MFIDRLNCPFRPQTKSSFSMIYLYGEMMKEPNRFIYLNARFHNLYSKEELKGLNFGGLNPSPSWLVL